MTNPEQLLDDALRDARDQALEEAARVCDERALYLDRHPGIPCAAWRASSLETVAGAIRALKSQETGE